MKWIPTVSDMNNIDTWSSIGVIFIMFTLGLEFSFKKIVKMGLSPIISAISVITVMITIGSLVGRAFGWSHMNSLFLGGMLAMSSTTIIYKALDELGLRQQKFANVVLSVLILEDILGILLMVILSALAVSSQFEGIELLNSFLKLGFFLIFWFVVGIFVIPLVLRRNSKWISKETLLIVSVGLCFLLVVLATKAGYSSAFGAFTMGSILAETLEAESIECERSLWRHILCQCRHVGRSLHPSGLLATHPCHRIGHHHWTNRIWFSQLLIGRSYAQSEYAVRFLPHSNR